MRRREFIALIAGAAALPLGARAQHPTKMPRIGIIDDGPIWDHFRAGLHDLGYIEGRSIAIEYRSAEAQPERLALAASELAQLPVDVIAIYGTAAAHAAKQATTTIPIVMIGIGDPVRAGLARAALMLAGTYDPIILEKLSIQGLASDIAAARTWYERAKEFGSAEAMRRLEILASRAR
jgi:hypothetical protein